MRREKIEADIEFRPKGLKELRKGWSDFAGDLLEPMVLLAAGATKAQAAWAGFRGMMEARVLGPLGLMAGISVGFLATTKMLVSRWRDLGMVASGALERMTLQFRPLLGSLERAKERVRELQDFSVKTPFEIDEIVEANKMLEQLTQGALSNEKGMTLVGDSASTAGQAFSDVARQVGRLYDGLMSGRPVGEATMRLQEMGIISGDVRNRIESMQAANESGIKIWQLVEQQLQRNTGAMELQSKSLEGLQSTYNDTKDMMEAGFSTGFREGEKAGIESSIKMMEAMTPVMENLGKEAGALENKWEKLKLKVVEGVTSWKGFGATVEWLIKGVVGLAAVLAGATLAAIGAFTVKMAGLVLGSKKAAEAMQYEAAVAKASIGVRSKMKDVVTSLTAAYRANAAGLKMEASAQLSNAAASARSIVTTNGLVAVVKTGRFAMRAMGMAVRFVGAQLRLMMVSLATNPIVWFMLAIAAVTAAISKWNQVQKENEARIKGFAKATSALETGLKKQITDIRTVVDLRRAENKILAELTNAYRELDSARNTSEREVRQNRVDMLKGQLTSLPGTGSLEMTEAEVSRRKMLREGNLRVREFERDAIAARGPDDALFIAEQRLEEINKRRREAIDLAREEAGIEERSAERRQQEILAEAERSKLLARRKKLGEDLEAIEKMKREGYGSVTASGNDPADAVLADIAAVNAALKDLEVNAENSALTEMLASPSELQQIKAKIQIMDRLKNAMNELSEAQEEIRQNEENEDKSKREELQNRVRAAREELKTAEKLADVASVDVVNPRSRQVLELRRDELEERRTEDLDPMRQAEAEKTRKDAAAAVAQARLESEAAIASLRLRGQEREERLLGIEREKLELARESQRISFSAYMRESDLLQAREEALARQGEERRRELAVSFTMAKLARQEEEARREGNLGRVSALQAQADKLRDMQVRADAQREAREMAATADERKNYVENRVKEERAAREAERKREEADRSLARDRTRTDSGVGLAGVEAEFARRQGQAKRARQIEEKAERERDEVMRREAALRYRDQGFSGAESDSLANRDVKLAQAQRLLSQGQRDGNVVASRLAKIGAGGNVAGTDPETKLLERMVKLLEDIRDDNKRTLDEDEF